MKRLNHNVRVLVTDGGRATVFRNRGQAGQPELEVVRTYAQDNPPTRELGTDKPARSNNPSGSRSSIEATDYHQQNEDRFVEQIAEDMKKDLLAGDFGELVVVAPPVALGVFRKKCAPQVEKATLASVNKDLTKHSAAELAAIVVKELEGE